MGKNAETVRGLFDALIAKQDMEAAAGFLSDDLKVTYWGSHSLAGEYKGPQEFFGLLGKEIEKTGGTLAPELHDVTDSDDHAIALLQMRAERDGKRYDFGHVVVSHVEDGKVTELFSFDNDEASARELYR